MFNIKQLTYAILMAFQPHTFPPPSIATNDNAKFDIWRIIFRPKPLRDIHGIDFISVSKFLIKLINSYQVWEGILLYCSISFKFHLIFQQSCIVFKIRLRISVTNEDCFELVFTKKTKLIMRTLIHISRKDYAFFMKWKVKNEILALFLSFTVKEIEISDLYKEVYRILSWTSLT